METDRKILQLGVQRVAHRSLDSRARLQDKPAPQGDQDRFADTQHEHDDDRTPDLVGMPVLQRPVDEGLQHLRYQERDDAREQCGHHPEVDAAHRGFRVRVDACDRLEGAWARLRATVDGRT